MLIYLIVLILLSLFSLVEISVPKKQIVVKSLSLDSVFYFFVSLFLLLFVALRFETGRDWQEYLKIFQNPDMYKGKKENGFLLINSLFNGLGIRGFYLLQFFLMMFCCGIVYSSIYINNEYPFFILFIYFCTYFFFTDLAQTRQYIAMAILALGRKCIIKRNFLHWCFIIFLAMQFHFTAIIAFPLYFTDRINFPKKLVPIFILLSFFITILGYKLVWVMLNIATKLKFIPSHISFLLNKYMTSSKFGKVTEFGSGLGFLLTNCFYFLFAFLWLLMDSDINDNLQKYHVLNFLIGINLIALGRHFDQIARLSYFYFLSGSGLSFYNVLPASIKFFKKTQFFRVSITFIYILFICYSFYTKYMGFYEYSYKSVIFQQF